MKLIKAKTQAEYFSCIWIRTLVFMHEQQIDPLLEIDEEDLTCEHYLVLNDGIYTGCARVIKEKDKWHIGRIAVLKEYRKQHFGSFILNEIEKLAIAEHIHILVLGAQEQAIPFYKSNGYTVCGDRYLDADIPHYPMEKHI